MEKNKIELEELKANFEEKYNISERVLNNYLDSYEIGDIMSVEVYTMIMINQCSPRQKDNLKEDLLEIVKQHKQSKRTVI